MIDPTELAAYEEQNMLSKLMKLAVLAMLHCICTASAMAQINMPDSLKSEFSLGLEIRPRTEYTYNYTLPPNEQSSPFINLTQRNRLSAKYQRRGLLLNAEAQEIHLLDKFHKSSAIAGLNFYQLYVETKIKGVGIRAGRQSVLLDNGRIFSDAPWSQQSRAHEGVRLMTRTGQLTHDFFTLFTRRYGDHFEKIYSPVASHNFKYLLIYQLAYNTGKSFSFNSISAMDVFNDQTSLQNNKRITTGGRLEFRRNHWYFTHNAYLQFGRTPRGQNLLAYYLQPEIRYGTTKITVRLGAELLSGTNPDRSKKNVGDFDVLYGVAWKFMGNMNLFTRFPTDVAGKGLVNPYLFVVLPLTKNLTARADLHLFYTQFPLINSVGQTQNKYLGFENDLSLKFFPTKKIEINYSFAYFKSSSVMQFLPKVLDANKISLWSYLMISYSLNMLHVAKTRTQE